MFRRLKTHSAAGFTLVELLVVVGIIVLLLSIVLPSLSGTRELAERSVCQSNIRQLHLANQGYAVDNRQYYVRAAYRIWEDNEHRWHGQRDTTSEAFDPARSDLARYMGDSGMIKECPSFVAGIDYDNSPGAASAFEAGCGGYGYNATYIGGRYDLHGSTMQASHHSARSTSPANPGRTVMFADTAYLQSGSNGTEQIAYSFVEPPYMQTNPGPPSSWRPNPSTHFRHAGTASVAWVDGHITAEPFAFTAAYQTHSNASIEESETHQIGWFGEDDANTRFDLK